METIELVVGAMWDALEMADSDSHIGVRADNAIVKAKFRRSYNRPDGTKTTRLPGVCAIYVGYNGFGTITIDMLRNAVIKASRYGDNLYLIVGESPNNIQHLSNDPGERIFTNHEILWRS